MGGALLRGWIRDDVIDAARSAVFDPSPPASIIEAAKDHRFAVNPAPDAGRYDALVVAVKPQIAGEALPKFRELAIGATAISVMAGKSLAAISAALPEARTLIRAMPNLPAAVGAGASAIFAPPGATARDREIAETLMRAVGAVVFVDSESAIDAVTAVSGSGPAYFFLLAEALADAAIAVGLEPAAAQNLARATLSGAGAYAAADERSLADLRRAVTSPGGTTDAALKILDGDDKAIRQLLRKAVDAAKRRAGELTG